MKNKSRRIFLRNSSLATTGVLLMSPLGATKKLTGSRQAIGCAPGSINSLTGTVGSVKSGKWSDPSTWGGKMPGADDTPVISAGHTVDVDMNTTVSGVNVNAGAVLQFDSSVSSELLSKRNIVVQGKLVMKPSSPSVVQKIRFIEINENNFVGGGHDVLNSDTGLWVMGAGQLDLSGSRKKSWSRTTGSVNRGAASFTVQDGNGWAVGDEIVLVPTDTPGGDTFNWDDRLDAMSDKFAAKFERRTIASISGNSVTVNAPFLYDHGQVSTDSGKTWTPEVANMSRNVRIEGTAAGRSHIFIRSTSPQNIYFIAGRYLGPRRSSSGSRSQLVTGRYGLHFHHCNFGSRGSMVDGCVISETGNRAYVPHTSHGVTMKNNVAFNCMEASFWWDFQEVTHNTTWEGNLTALVALNGGKSAKGMEMNMGDGNICRNNVVVYGHNGDEHQQGAYVWNADSEGVWIFENNLSHSNGSGLFVWQNTGNNHTIVGQESYNDRLGIFHGAYVNSYTYTNCYFYNSLVRVKATSGNSSGVRFEKTVFDGGNLTPFVTDIFPSPVPSGGDFNAFRDCTFKNYRDYAVRMNTFPISGELTRKNVSLIKCNFSGKMVGYSRESIFDSKVFVQPASGPCSVISQAGTSAIASFAPYIYGNGMGLKGEYYTGSNFANYAFTRNDSMIMFVGWTYNKKFSPNGVHHLISGDQYSIRWTGKVEAQYSESYKFRVEGGGGFRLWVNNVQIINSWVERHDNKDTIISPAINLVAGQKYDIKLEHMNMAGSRGCQLFWECPSIGRSIHIPQSQLYSDQVIAPPPPPPAPNQPAVANAGADITITLPVNKAQLNGTASSPAASIKSYEWIRMSGPNQGSIVSKNAVSTEVTNLVEGTYVFRLQVTSSTGVVTNDEVTVKINPANNPAQPPVANAGADTTITLPINFAILDAAGSSPKDSIKSYEWTKVSGPGQANIENKSSVSTKVRDLVEGTYVFNVKITDKNEKVANADVRVIVKPQPPVANAGSDVSIVLPVSSVVLNGSGSSAPAGIKKYEWSKVSGPAKFKIVNVNAISPVIKDLEKGTYVFKLQITDKNGTTAVDEVTVTVSVTATTDGKTTDQNQNQNNNESSGQLSVRAWPNPSSHRTPNFFAFASDSKAPLRVTIYDQYGKAVSSWTRVPVNSSIKWTEGMKQGTHFVVVEQGSVKKTIQLIKF